MIVFQEDLVAESKCEIELSAEEVEHWGVPDSTECARKKESERKRDLSVVQCHYSKKWKRVAFQERVLDKGQGGGYRLFGVAGEIGTKL